MDDNIVDENNIENRLQQYFDELFSIFENSSINNELDKSYFIRMCNRIITVGNDLNKMYFEDNKTASIEENIGKMNIVNEKIRELIK